jgi:hypothetical protein
MAQPIPDADLSRLESALAGLKPAGHVARDALFYKAGQASHERSLRRWRWAAGLLGGVALGLVSWLALCAPTAPRERVQYVVVKEPAPPAPSEPRPIEPVLVQQQLPQNEVVVRGTLSGNSYLLLRDQAVRWGVEALPRRTADPTSGQPLTAGSLRGLPAGAIDRFGSPRLSRSPRTGASL